MSMRAKKQYCIEWMLFHFFFTYQSYLSYQKHLSLAEWRIKVIMNLIFFLVENIHESRYFSTAAKIFFSFCVKIRFGWCTCFWHCLVVAMHLIALVGKQNVSATKYIVDVRTRLKWKIRDRKLRKMYNATMFYTVNYTIDVDAILPHWKKKEYKAKNKESEQKQTQEK